MELIEGLHEMTTASNGPLSAKQLETLRGVFHIGAADASVALEKWLGHPSSITIDSIEQLPLCDATGILGGDDEPVCICAMAMRGILTGQLIFIFDDRSGLALADMLMGREEVREREWGELETSAALESANIIGCAYLNSLQKHLPGDSATDELMPSPPVFRRDFAESLLQFAFMSQATEEDIVFLTQTQFQVDQTRMNWTLLVVPDGSTIETLRQLLTE